LRCSENLSCRTTFKNVVPAFCAEVPRRRKCGYIAQNLLLPPALLRCNRFRRSEPDCSVVIVNGKMKVWGNNYAYDEWGNLNQKTVTKCGAENLSVVSLTNNQVTGYGYDAAGNMTNDPTDFVTSVYDQENHISVATKNSVATTYVYDADGNRVHKSNGTSGTLYWYMAPGIVAESDLSGNPTSEYVFFNGERVARKDFPSGAVSYYFSDHLKTASVITDAAGHINAESDYYPWGGELQFVNNDGHCLEDACLIETGVAVSFLVIASAQYLSLPSNQRSLAAAASYASSKISGWFHKSDNNSKPSASPAPAAPVGATPAPTTTPAAPTGTATPATPTAPAVPGTQTNQPRSNPMTG
jgi:hypothetical protein